MNIQKRTLYLALSSILGTGLLATSSASAQLVPDGEWQIQIIPTAIGTNSYGTFFKIVPGGVYESSFTFGQAPYSGSNGMTDNNTKVTSAAGGGVAGGVGSGVAGDGFAGTINIQVTGNTFTVVPGSFHVDTIFVTAGGSFAQYVGPFNSPLNGDVGGDTSRMSGTIDNSGNLTFTPTNRYGAIDGPNPDVFDRRWTIDSTASSAIWNSFTTGTTQPASPTSGTGPVTGVPVTAGADINGDGIPDYTTTMVSSGRVGSDWQTFTGNPYYEVWKARIVSVNVVLNRAPSLSISVSQGGPATSISNTGGNVTVNSGAVDPDGDTMTFAWTIPACSSVVGLLTGSTVTFNPVNCPAGANVTTSVSVDDGHGHVVPGQVTTAMTTTTVADTNGNGIPDANDHNPASTSLIQTSAAAAYNAITDVGHFKLGDVATCVSANGIGVTEAQIFLKGGAGCTAPANTTAETLPQVGGIFDFKLTNLTNGQIAHIVLPLSAAIPANARYRKYTPIAGWHDFQTTGNDSLSSAPGTLGLCPSPTDVAYKTGLNAGDYCVQLTIQDNSSNDSDPSSGSIADPGVVVQGAPPIPPPPTQPSAGQSSFSANSGGCTVSTRSDMDLSQRADLGLLGMFLAWLGLTRRKHIYKK